LWLFSEEINDLHGFTIRNPHPQSAIRIRNPHPQSASAIRIRNPHPQSASAIRIRNPHPQSATRKVYHASRHRVLQFQNTSNT
jgi:hypothetical protein